MDVEDNTKEKQLHKKMKLIPGSGSPSGFTSRFSLVTCSLISVRAAQVWVKKHANFRFRMFRFSFRFHIQVPNPLTSIDQTASVRAVHVEEAREEVGSAIHGNLNIHFYYCYYSKK